MPRKPVGIVVGNEREGGGRVVPPSPNTPLGPLFIVSGSVFALVGWVDIALFHVPLRREELEWQFGVIAQSLDAMALPTLGLVLLSIGVLLRGGSLFWSKLMGTVLGGVAVVCFGALLLFSRNIPLALEAAEASENTTLLSGLRVGIAKAVLFGSIYGLAYGWMAVMLWRAGAKGSKRAW